MEFIRPKKLSLSFDMAPLIDIVFQLLIFFMLSSSFLNPAIKLDLPKSAKHDERQPEQIMVNIDKSGTIFLNAQKTSLEALKRQLQDELRKDSSKKAVHIRGDKDMPYKFFVEVMDISRQSGAQQINIIHQEAV